VPGNKENRATEISEISRSLKALAKELKVPSLHCRSSTAAWSSTSGEEAGDVGSSGVGSLEQDADVILLIYREEVYDKNTTRRGIADIIIAKQRKRPDG